MTYARRLLALTLLAAAILPWCAYGQGAPVATHTKAARGLGWGAMIGGALGGLSLGVLASGLCDAADCSGSFLEGFFPGVLLGSAAGGLSGLVIGSGLPEDGRAVGGWSWTARVGLRRAGAADVSGIGPVVDVHGLRAITDRTRFGVALEYLGDSTRRAVFAFTTRDGAAFERTEERELHIAAVRLLAARLLGDTPRSGGYLVGSVGLHPTWETRRLSAGGPYDEHTSSSAVLVPGGGVGVGTRGDMILGIGGSGVVPMARLAIGVRRGG